MRAGATGRVLHDSRGGSFRFDAGAACLDFAHTGGEGIYAVFETLHQPSDLAEWLAQPPLSAVVTLPVTADELTMAKRLRQGIWEAAHQRAAGRAVSAATVEVINAAAAQAPLVPELDAGATTARWAEPVTATQALASLAREMVDLLTGSLANRIRECSGDNCPLVFVDSSRPGQRRWCSMERCGNRSKLRTRRARGTGGANGTDRADRADGADGADHRRS